VVQNIQNTVIYDVKDLGLSLAEGARLSVTNYETFFHTDNAFGSFVLDYVGLMCLNKAKEGGLSLLLSGYEVLKYLKENHQEEFKILTQPFHHDRRGGRKEMLGIAMLHRWRNCILFWTEQCIGMRTIVGLFTNSV